jgi:glycyl-tRNA synthetase
LPLLKTKEELTKVGLEIFNQLKFSVDCQYDDKDAIGRRYRRQDAIGTPFCITVDFETLENQTVTIRERDTLKQERIHIKDIERIVLEKTDMRILFAKLANT